MAKILNRQQAFGAPGIEPRWTHSNKDGVGTAYSTSSKVWFTLWKGILTEVYFPFIDQPQVRDLQYLITDGQSFFHEEKRDLKSQTELLWNWGLGYRLTNTAPDESYSIVKQVISDPHSDCILQHTKLTGDSSVLDRLKLYALCAPHLNISGWGNNGYVIEVGDRKFLVANKGDKWLVVGATVPFKKLSCGYVGNSDGWQDLADNYQMDWEFDRAENGNIGLTGELDLTKTKEFTLGLAFGFSLENALANLLQSLNTSFEQQQQTFKQQWLRTCDKRLPLESQSSDNGNLYHTSVSLLLAHEDKTYSGATIAAMSFPWGEKKGDGDRGGYHLVWTRDMVNSVTGLMAAGHTDTAVRALTYLVTCQHEDGSFAQNFWLNGEPYWQGMQLDEVAFPLLLADALERVDALPVFDVYPMIIRAAGYLIRQGPATQQERWEEDGGYSPSTLACNIAALICAARFARQRGDEVTAQYIEEYADFLKDHTEAWTVTTQGTLLPEIKRHFVRITPAKVDVPHPNEDPNNSTIILSARPPGTESEFSENKSAEFPTKEVVDAGFLLFVRYGIIAADDPLIIDSLKVIDAVLKVDTPYGSVWRRFNHDWYGQKEDGSAYQGVGVGRAWPLLAGERAHYELAAGNDVTPFIKAIEGFASDTGLLTEQVWDSDDIPDAHMYLGRPTGAAMPLMWAHAEYTKLLRSCKDKRVFDYIPEVGDRYLNARSLAPDGDAGSHRYLNNYKSQALEVWKFHRQVTTVAQGNTLRIQTEKAFKLRWTQDEWQTQQDLESTAIAPLNLNYADLKCERLRIEFTFFWTDSSNWSECNYTVEVI